jgi:hypothetical protein
MGGEGGSAASYVAERRLSGNSLQPGHSAAGQPKAVPPGVPGTAAVLAERRAACYSTGPNGVDQEGGCSARLDVRGTCFPCAYERARALVRVR